MCEYENSKEAGESVRAAEALLGQISKNTSDLSHLHDRVEHKVAKHVDVREALLQKKNEEIEAVQKKMYDRIELEVEEQKQLRQLIESLEKQIKDRDSDIRNREKQLNLEKEQFEYEKRQFMTEKEIAFSRLEDEQTAVTDKENALSRERKELHSAMEAEHRKIIASKMKLTVHRKINEIPAAPSTVVPELKDDGDLLPEENGCLQLELNAMADAFRDEKSKLTRQRENLKKVEEKINVTKEKVKQKQKV